MKNRPVDAILVEAELMSSSAERVYEWLEKRNSITKQEQLRKEIFDEELEFNLLAREDALITLGLARYGAEEKVLSKIFSKAISSSNVLVLACLSNQIIGRKPYAWNAIPNALFNGKKDDTNIWLKAANENEIATLFANPLIYDDFLEEFLSCKSPWLIMNDDLRLVAIHALHTNPRIQQRYEGMMDGYAEYKHNSVFSAAWKLSELVEVNKKWANALGWLYQKIEIDRYAMNVGEVAKRWMVYDKDDNKDDKKAYLGPYEMVRAGLYRGTIKSYGKDIQKELDNEDIAYRAIAYSELYLTPEQINYAYVKDKLLAITYMLENNNIWRKEETRKALHDICWDADSKYNSNNMDCANLFNFKNEYLESKHKEWFAEKEEVNEIEEDEMQVTVGKLKEVSTWQLHELFAEIIKVQANVIESNKRTKWILIAIAVVFFITITKH